MSGSFDNAVRKHGNLISDNLYYTHLMRYLDYFPAENVLVTLYDDLQSDQAAFIRNIYTFLGVDPAFEPNMLGVRSNPSSLPRFKIINRAAFCAAWLLRFLDMRSLFERAKQSEFIRRLLFKKSRDDDFLKMSDESRKYLQEAFRAEIAKLSDHLGRNLDSWK